jgi:hypothetical protein
MLGFSPKRSLVPAGGPVGRTAVLCRNVPVPMLFLQETLAREIAKVYVRRGIDICKEAFPLTVVRFHLL